MDSNLDLSHRALQGARGPALATWALASIAVCLRFIARRMSKSGFWYDDWLLVPALV